MKVENVYTPQQQARQRLQEKALLQMYKAGELTEGKCLLCDGYKKIWKVTAG